MRRFRGAMVATVALAVVLVAWVFLPSANDDVDPSMLPTSLVRFDKEALTSIAVERVGERLVFERVDGGWAWVGRDWRPRKAMVRRMAHQLHALDARAMVDSAPDRLEAYGLGQGAIQVSWALRGGGVGSLRVGAANPTGVSHYVQVPPDAAVYLVQRAAVDMYSEPLISFREDRITAFDAEDVVGITARVGGRAMRVERVGDDAWRLTEPEAFDASQDRVQWMLGRVSALRASSFVQDHPSDVAQYGITPESDEVRVLFGSGPALELVVGDREGSERLVLHRGDDAIYRVKGAFLSAFSLAVTEYRNRQLVGRHGWQVTEMRVQSEGREVVLRQSAGSWRWSDGEVVTGTGAAALARQVAELEALSFPDLPRPAAFGSPDLLITLRFADGATVRLHARRPESVRKIGETLAFARVDDSSVVAEINGSIFDIVANLLQDHEQRR